MRKGRVSGVVTLAFIGLVAIGFSVGLLVPAFLTETQAAPKTSNKLDAPTITCVGETQHTIFLKVCAGPSGAPAGFSVHWQKHSLLPDLTCGSSGQTWPGSDSGLICGASLSGTPGCSIYNLPPNGCVTIEIGNLNDAECGVSLSSCAANELECDTEYIFRVFAHNESGKGGKERSDFSKNYCCSTESCVAGCTFTQGYWKTHGPVGCNPSGGANVWPVTSLTIGGAEYTDADLCTNLNLAGQGNAVRILSHQLIAAMLNVANGAVAPPDCDMEAASALLNGLNINSSSVATSTALGQQMTAAAACLDLYNNGDGGIPHCP